MGCDNTFQDMTDSKSTPNMGSVPRSKGVPNLMDSESNSDYNNQATPNRNSRGRSSGDEAENGRETPGRGLNGITLTPQVLYN